MYFLERKETYAMPNILENHSMPYIRFVGNNYTAARKKAAH